MQIKSQVSWPFQMEPADFQERISHFIQIRQQHSSHTPSYQKNKVLVQNFEILQLPPWTSFPENLAIFRSRNTPCHVGFSAKRNGEHSTSSNQNHLHSSQKGQVPMANMITLNRILSLSSFYCETILRSTGLGRRICCLIQRETKINNRT
jgi:hypothetical protein